MNPSTNHTDDGTDVPPSLPIDAGEPCERESSRVTLRDQTYRWSYVVRLWRDPFTPALVLKVLLLASLAPALLELIINVFEGNPGQGLRSFVSIYAITAGIVLGLFVIGYLLFMMVKGGRFTVLYEMDEEGITHQEAPKSAKRSKWIHRVGIVLGALSTNPNLSGANMLAAANVKRRSEFASVRKVILHEKACVLRLSCSDMTRNIVYTLPDDFAFVQKFILDRCPPTVRVIMRKTS